MTNSDLLDKIEIQLAALMAKIELLKQGPPNNPPFVVCQPGTNKAFLNP